MAAAQSAIQRKDYEGAVNDLKPLVSAYPRYAPAWFDLAYAYSGLNQNDDAVSAYHKAIENDPKLYQARLNLGILLLNMNRPADALPQLKEAAALKPQDARARLYLGRAYELTGDAADAGKELQNAAALKPSSAESLVEVGQFEFNQKDFSAARDAFEKAAAMDPKLAEAQLGAGMALVNLKQEKAAIPYLEQYLSANPTDLKTRFELASVQRYLGEGQDALQNFQVIEQKSPSFPGLDEAFAIVYGSLKQFPAAEKYDRLAIASSPNQAPLHRNLGDVLMQERNYPEAESEFRTALKLDNHDRDAATGLAASLYFQKRYTEAIPLLQQLVQAPPATASNYFFLAASYDQLHDTRPAITAYQQFLSLAQGGYPDQVWQAQQRIKLLQHELQR